MATPSEQHFVAIALLLSEPKAIDLQTVQIKAEFAFRDAPAKPLVKPIPNKPLFAVQLGPLQLGVVSVDRPYFKDVDATANRVRDVAGRMAVLQHKAWLSVDQAGQAPIDEKIVLGLIGLLAAEFCDNSVLGMIRLPKGPVIGYDYSFIPLLRARKAEEVFTKGRPDRIVGAPASSAELKAATAEAKRRWPEFESAFRNRQRGDGFGVKKKFEADGKVEHMWINVTAIEGSTIRGQLANDPRVIKSLKMRDVVSAEFDKIKDWLVMRGAEQLGGFQAKVLKS